MTVVPPARARVPSHDTSMVLLARAARGLGSGYLAVVLGVDLHARGVAGLRLGLVLGAIVGGAALALLAVRRFADRAGRRRLYVAGHLAQAAAGVVLSLEPAWWVLVVAGLLGTLASEANDAGPLGALEQVMLASALSEPARLRAFGRYGAIGAAAGSLGSLAAGAIGLVGSGAGAGVAFLPLIPLGVLGAGAAVRLSASVEHVGAGATGSRADVLDATTRTTVRRLSGLFAVDAFGSGFTVQAFVAYWLARAFDASPLQIGVIFLVVGLVQTGSMLLASRLGERFGLLRTMVFTHLPSNALLAAVGFAPNLAVAATALCLRSSLSQMDVPTRTAYVMALVPPSGRTRAASTTGLARLVGRPVGALLTGSVATLAAGGPFVVAGALKAAYDLSLWAWFRRVRLPDAAAPSATSHESREAPDALDDP